MNDFELPTKILILTDPCEIADALKVSAYKSAVWDYDQWLRSEVKYNNNEEAQVYRNKFREFIDEYNIVFD